jgi:hypothetical protein
MKKPPEWWNDWLGDLILLSGGSGLRLPNSLTIAEKWLKSG